jgi:hypothetical protein
MVKKILDNTTTYEGLPQYKHIVDLETDVDREAKIPKLEKISDILAVLAAVEALPGTPLKMVNACRDALWKSDDKDQRHEAINALRNVLLPIKGGRRTFRRKGLPRLY